MSRAGVRTRDRAGVKEREREGKRVRQREEDGRDVDADTDDDEKGRER